MRRLVVLLALIAASLAPAEADARRRGAIDVNLRGADLVESLRFLADAADVGLVVVDDVHGRVDVTLKHVDPLAALMTIAELKGAEATFADGVVTVRSRRAAPR